MNQVLGQCWHFRQREGKLFSKVQHDVKYISHWGTVYLSKLLEIIKESWNKEIEDTCISNVGKQSQNLVNMA